MVRRAADLPRRLVRNALVSGIYATTVLATIPLAVVLVSVAIPSGALSRDGRHAGQVLRVLFAEWSRDALEDSGWVLPTLLGLLAALVLADIRGRRSSEQLVFLARDPESRWRFRRWSLAGSVVAAFTIDFLALNVYGAASGEFEVGRIGSVLFIGGVVVVLGVGVASYDVASPEMRKASIGSALQLWTRARNMLATDGSRPFGRSASMRRRPRHPGRVLASWYALFAVATIIVFTPAYRSSDVFFLVIAGATWLGLWQLVLSLVVFIRRMTQSGLLAFGLGVPLAIGMGMVTVPLVVSVVSNLFSADWRLRVFAATVLVLMILLAIVWLLPRRVVQSIPSLWWTPSASVLSAWRVIVYGRALQLTVRRIEVDAFIRDHPGPNSSRTEADF